jgi:hypothetical protein
MRFYILFFVAVSLNSFSQNIQKLDEKNGFRDIKLGSEISSYPYVIKAENVNGAHSLYVKNTPFGFCCEYNYVVNPSENNYVRLDNEKILSIYLSVFRGKIRKILVVCEYRPTTLTLLKTVFGEPNGFGMQWSGENVYCYYHSVEDSFFKKPAISMITFIDKKLDILYEEEKYIKAKSDKKQEQERVNSKF